MTPSSSDADAFETVTTESQQRELVHGYAACVSYIDALVGKLMETLKECGIDLRNVKDRLRTESDNFPLEVFFLRDDDIPQYVEDGVADIGIVGENVLFEKGKSVEVVENWMERSASNVTSHFSQ